MLYLIAEQLGFPGVLNLIRYISFRAGAASATALLIGLVLGPWLISQLRVRQGKGQPIRTDGPQSHLAKRGTPTMGGLLILISMATSVLLWMDLRNAYVWALLTMKARADESRSLAQPMREAVPVASAPARQRYAADASNRTARPAFNGLPALGDDLVNIVVRPAAEVDAARI